MIDFLKGKKTYIMGALGLLVVGLWKYGIMDDAMAAQVLTVLGFGQVIALRAGLSKIVLAGLLVLTFAGCAPSDQIAVDRAHFLLAYADTKATYSVLAFQFHQGCVAKAIPVAVCEQLAPVEAKLKTLDPEIRFLILHPEVEPDWGKISAVLGLIVELALKAGGVP